MKTILYFENRGTTAHTSRPKLLGFLRFANIHGWQVQKIPYSVDVPDLDKLIDFWHADGCVVEGGGLNDDFPLKSFGRTPAVFIDGNPNVLGPRAFMSINDMASCGELAARELLSIGLRNFAFIGTKDRHYWSDQRGDGFVAAVTLNGYPVKRCPSSGKGLDEVAFVDSLKDWLGKLPKPCGIYTGNDFTAEFVLKACHLGGFRITEDFSVIGNDNLDVVCEHTSPPLSSVMPDFEQSGFVAGEILADRFHSQRARPIQRRTRALTVVRRQSAIPTFAHASWITKAIALIRERACDGLTAAEVVRDTGVSRSLAYLRFREATGQSILDMIQSVRIAQAKALQAEGTQTTTEIARACGYASYSAFLRVYRAHTGKVPSGNRRR